MDIDDHGISADLNLKMVAASFKIPKKDDDYSNPFGEDALFICKDEQAMGIADGVGSWAKDGVSAGEYASELMQNALYSVVEQNDETGCVSPKQALQDAFLSTYVEGSSTACIMVLKDDFLHAVNLGDSGFMVIRRGKVEVKTQAQQWRFNCPYQLGLHSVSKPSDAQELSAGLERGDVVVAGTDGLFDNLYTYDIENIVNACMRLGTSPKEMASTLAKSAWERSVCEDFVSPFTKSAVEAGLDMEDYMGGKCDDISVIVAYIQ